MCVTMASAIGGPHFRTEHTYARCIRSVSSCGVLADPLYKVCIQSHGWGLSGCRSGEVIAVGDERDERGRGGLRGPYAGRAQGPHYPPPGEYRIWHPDREPGHQPPPAKYDRLVGRVPYGAVILYGKEWESRYDWGSMNAAAAEACQG